MLSGEQLLLRCWPDLERATRTRATPTSLSREINTSGPNLCRPERNNNTTAATIYLWLWSPTILHNRKIHTLHFPPCWNMMREEAIYKIHGNLETWTKQILLNLYRVNDENWSHWKLTNFEWFVIITNDNSTHTHPFAIYYLQFDMDGIELDTHSKFDILLSKCHNVSVRRSPASKEWHLTIFVFVLQLVKMMEVFCSIFWKCYFNTEIIFIFPFYWNWWKYIPTLSKSS